MRRRAFYAIPFLIPSYELFSISARDGKKRGKWLQEEEIRRRQSHLRMIRALTYSAEYHKTHDLRKQCVWATTNVSPEVNKFGQKIVFVFRIMRKKLCVSPSFSLPLWPWLFRCIWRRQILSDNFFLSTSEKSDVDVVDLTTSTSVVFPKVKYTNEK